MAAQEEISPSSPTPVFDAEAGAVPPVTPPLPSAAPPPVGSPPTETTPPPPEPKEKPSIPKELIFIGLGIVVLGLIIFLVIKVVLPLLGKQKTKEASLTWWGLWEDEVVVAPLIAEYEQQNPNVKITYVEQASRDYRERLTNALAKGTGPDIFRIHNSWVPMFINELDVLPNSVMSAEEYSQAFFPVIAKDMATSQGFVGLPLGFDTIGLFINQEIFEKSGKTVPRTWDDLRATAIELTIKDENGVIQQSGVALGRTENVDHWPEILGLMLLQNGVKMSQPSGKVAEDALDFFALFSNAEGVWDETLPPSTAFFAAGRLAMYFGPSWRIFEIKQQNPDLDFQVVPVPQLPQESSSQTDVSYATYWVEGVWAESKNKTEAWKFLKFMTTQASLQKLYQNASQARLFGEPYPRTDMIKLLTDDPWASTFVTQGSTAQSWYLQSRTFDGPTGINSQIDNYFADAINAINQGDEASDTLEPLNAGLNQVLSQYGLVSAQGSER